MQVRSKNWKLRSENSAAAGPSPHTSYFILLTSYFILLTSYFILPTFAFAADNPNPYAAEKLVGKQAPDFTLNDLNGKATRLSENKGKVVILFFWASWCPTGPDEFRSIEKLHAKYKDRGLIVLAVSSDKTQAAAKDFAARNPVTFPVLLDEKMTVSKPLYKAFMIPMTFIINKSGVIINKHFGVQDWTKPAIVKEIESLLM
jgi:peroxiredoxin